MKIQSLSTHPHADGRLSDVFWPQNTAAQEQEKGTEIISHKMEVNVDLFSNLRKMHNKAIKCLHAARPK